MVVVERVLMRFMARRIDFEILYLEHLLVLLRNRKGALDSLLISRI